VKKRYKNNLRLTCRNGRFLVILPVPDCCKLRPLLWQKFINFFSVLPGKLMRFLLEAKQHEV
jgi:hypothetical protein